MVKETILLVDGDGDLSKAFIGLMTLHSDFFVHWEKNVVRAIETARAIHISLLIIEVDFPDMDGREAVRILRKGGFTAPIVMLTAQSADSDVILGLEFGADDYVTKPFKFPVLLARIRALMRQYERSLDVAFTIGEFTFHPFGNHLISDRNGRRICLTKKESAILKFLYRAGPEGTPRNVLLREVWGYHPKVATHTLETHIYRLRKKIEPNPAKSVLLVTVAGGYKLVP